ncbi:RIC1-domain-containing protein [Trametes versicolor FP-101664 SS1]|uniref:RIC1-domain-containing protein n=1 Tax=Trametes versicolor (strain FP-101664) TaxID=717944 RepID=UPI0004623FE1|nr:RIC1-domain-containing protein [Trametes versicolor FP-101664 SS1]EIW64556.1 RIC1-domain-containing protein [Trametes versicolor FP-101664 SS1]
MYFPTSAARQLSSAPALPLPSELVLALAPSPRKTLFATVTKSGLSLWRVRPSAVLAHLSRSETSLQEHGENLHLHWSPDGQRIVVQTTESYLVLITVEYNAEEVPYQTPPLAANAARHFLPGAGEALPLQSLNLHLEGVIRIEGSLLSVSPRKEYILFSTCSPPSIQRVPWPDSSGAGGGHGRESYDTWEVNEEELPWLVDPDVTVCQISYHRQTGFETWITSDGRAYLVQLYQEQDVRPDASETSAADDEHTQLGHLARERSSSDSTSSSRPLQWHGTCTHHVDPPRWVQKRKHVDPGDVAKYAYTEPRRAMAIALNPKFSMLAVGTYSGTVEFASLPSMEGALPKPQVLQIPTMYAREGTGSVCTMEWSSDGYVLAVGWEKGWAIWSVGGRCLAWGFGVEYEVDAERFQDAFMYGVRGLFWAPGNFELVMLAQSSPNMADGQLFVLPFAKSATTGQHSPDNTQYAFLQMDDRVLVYRGADQPDMSVINPEADVWQHVKVPQSYMSANWPIRYSSLSADGRLIAIAGRRGLVHYSSTSGRWKMFADELQEQAFTVKGGLLWFHHVLIAAVEVAGAYQLRLYSRDLELSNQNVLHRELVPSPVVILSLVDNSLLVYMADNTLYHYLIIPTADSIKLHFCGSITFDGVIAVPSAVRALSWMIPSAQKQLGDPADDLAVATVLMIVGGKLVLLRPRKSEEGEVKYDMQILADRIEFCWIHLRGIGTLENSLWGYDGQGIRVWLNALAIESAPPPTEADDGSETVDRVKESVNIPLEFYPLSVLMDKGIIIGVEVEAATRTNLSFTMFRHVTSSHLFLHHILLFHLENSQCKEAVTFASHYQHLVYFAHALEILLHTVVEEDVDAGEPTEGSQDSKGSTEQGLLSGAIEFLDHFDDALDVVVGCARKIEMTRWPRLFDVVGNPKILFESCLSSGRLKTAGSYLLVLHGLEQLDGMNDDVIRLLRSATAAQDWQLCREILRFLHSIDDTGAALQSALVETQIVPSADSQLGQGNGSAH